MNIPSRASRHQAIRRSRSALDSAAPAAAACGAGVTDAPDAVALAEDTRVAGLVGPPRCRVIVAPSTKTVRSHPGTLAASSATNMTTAVSAATSNKGSGRFIEDLPGNHPELSHASAHASILLGFGDHR